MIQVADHPPEWAETRCELCVLEGAWHKIEEDTDVNSAWDAANHRFLDQHRHPFTAYICCRCFGRLMGGAARNWCEEFWACARVAKLLADSKEEI